LQVLFAFCGKDRHILIVPKKSGLMNEREKGICARLKQLREDLRFSQPAFARELRITLDQLASIEYGRVPLRYALGEWICWRFDVNQRWLAEGRKPKDYCFFISPRVLNHITNPQVPFSEAYDQLLKKNMEEHLKWLAKELRCAIEEINPEDAHFAYAGALNNASPEVFNLILSRALKSYTRPIPQVLFGAYYVRIREASQKFAAEFKAQLEQEAEFQESRNQFSKTKEYKAFKARDAALNKRTPP
jgi:transcriptional regulator with XRE-family HTH domain